MNKKIINSSVTEGFKSKLEKRAYELFITAGFNVQYEPEKYILWKGDTVDIKTVRFKKGDIAIKNKHTLRDITYTPDFKIVYKGYTIYIDSKGHVNDVYPLKKKMFLQYLNNKVKHLFFEPHSVKQMVQTIDIIKKL